jgi:hypothetical protein
MGEFCAHAGLPPPTEARQSENLARKVPDTLPVRKLQQDGWIRRQKKNETLDAQLGLLLKGEVVETSSLNGLDQEDFVKQP